MKSIATLISVALAGRVAVAQSTSTSASSSCPSTLTANYPAPSVAPGYVARLVANNLTAPRGIKFDDNGSLLVVEQNKGITALTFAESGSNCITLSGRKTVITDATLNHGIEMSPNGSILYASSGDTMYAWSYSSSAQTNTSAPRALVTGMAGSDHTTRTLLLSRKVPDLMLISRGSFENIDPIAEDITSGHSQIRAFNIANVSSSPYNYDTDGRLLGWGLRNDVGIDEEPLHGGIYAVENSADQVMRDDVDIHDNNPAEELNFLGFLNGTYSSNQGRNFGYPECFAAWNASAIPRFQGATGQQFAIGTPNATLNDTTCDAANRQAPRLSFQAHMAPLDLLFNEAGTAAWITFHGSWNRDIPAGYKLSVVEFANGEPVEANTSTTAAVDIVSNADITACPSGCFRPVGLAWDKQGRLFMSSDRSGEIYVIYRADGNATSTIGSNATGTIPSPSPSMTGMATMLSTSALAVAFAVFAFWL